MCHQKGGVGTTTTTSTVGAGAAASRREGRPGDLAAQGAAAGGLGLRAHGVDQTIYTGLVAGRPVAYQVIRPTGVPGLGLVPASIDLSAAVVQLDNEVARDE